MEFMFIYILMFSMHFIYFEPQNTESNSFIHYAGLSKFGDQLTYNTRLYSFSILSNDIVYLKIDMKGKLNKLIVVYLLILCGDIESNPGPTSTNRVTRSIISLYSNKEICNKCDENILTKNIGVHKCQITQKYTNKQVNKKVTEELFEKIQTLNKENQHLKLKLKNINSLKSNVPMKTDISTQTDFQSLHSQIENNKYQPQNPINESTQSFLKMNYSLANSSTNSSIRKSSKYDNKKEKLATKKLDDDDIKIYLVNKTDIPKNTILLEPAISHLIKNSTDFHFIVGEINIADYDYIIVPLSDSCDNNLGTHWSTLIFNRLNNEFFHLDSIKGYNDASAKRIAKRLNECFLLKSKPKIITVDCIQQRNDTDCGYHMLHNINLICNNLIKNELLISSNNYLKPIPIKYYSEQILTMKNLHLSNNINPNKVSLTTPTKCVSKQSKEDLHDQYSPKLLKTEFVPVTSKQHIDLKDSTSFLKDNIFKTLMIPTEKLSCIKLVTDSHGRNLRQKLVNKLNNDYFVQAHISPNAKLGHILNKIEFEATGLTKNDFLIIVGGTNDIDDRNINMNLLIKNIDEKLKAIINTNIVLSSIPYRYDKPFYNKKIRKINNIIRMISYNHSHVYYLPLQELSRIDYTYHGLHLNDSGKDKIVSIIHKTIKSETTSEQNNIPVIITERKHFLGQKYKLYNKKDAIKQIQKKSLSFLGH